MNCIKILCILQRLAFSVQCFENKFWYHCSLKTELLQEITQIFRFNSLLCWRRINRIVGFSKMGWIPTQWKQQKLSCGASSATALSGMDFGHHNPQTLYHLTSFSEDFLKKVYSNNPKRLEDLKHNTKQAVAITNQQTLTIKAAKTLWKRWMLVFRKVRDIFSICCNYTLFYHILGYLWKK